MADDALECDSESRPETVDDDQTLVSAAQRDTEAAGRLYDKYYREVFGYVYHCTLDRTATEDLTSNVFLAAFRHLGRYRWRQIPFRAWLYRIATNEVRMHFRRRKRDRVARPNLFDRDCSDAFGGTGRHAQVALGRATRVAEGLAPSADEGPAAAEEYRLLHQALQELRSKYRTVIVLRYFENKTMVQIAEITGAREGTIKSQLHRGLARLQEILRQRGVLPQ
jgi:RNA polymerase sigma-70 factor (ECF subfamily)